MRDVPDDPRMAELREDRSLALEPFGRAGS